MRQPNYQLGWYIPNQIAALTHFHPDVTAEDFLGVVQAGQELLQHQRAVATGRCDILSLRSYGK
jgi:hypothetical protein